MARLSLCLIARDEEAFLPGCLASVKGVVDEIVVADTGSVDATPSIAAAAGAVVVPHVWRDDFAAARNAALERATGDWILLLDADERLAPWAGEVIRRAIDDDRLDCGLLPLHNATRLDYDVDQVVSGRQRRNEPFLLPRLFRRTPDLAWDGAIHEGIIAWITAPGRRCARVEADIVHLGAIPELRASRNKWERNVNLLRQRLEREPDYVTGYSYLAGELVRAGREEEAFAVAQRGWAALERVLGTGGPKPSPVTLTSLLAQLLSCKGRHDEALAIVARARACSAWHPNYDWLEARIYIVRASFERHPRVDDLEKALVLLARGLAARDRMFTEEPIPGIYGHSSYREAGTACLMLGRAEAALEWFGRVLAEVPGDETATLGRVEALLLAGAARQALFEVEVLMGSGRADVWILAALAAEALGRHDDALLLGRRGLRNRERGLVLPRRLFHLEQLGLPSRLDGPGRA